MSDTHLFAANDDGVRYRKLIELGIALSAQRDHDRLMEMILLGAKELTNADGGTLYLRTEDNRLAFEIMRNDTLDIAMGGTTGKAIPFPSLALYDEAGQPNRRTVASCAAIDGITINIADAYDAENFDFSGTKTFDAGTGYRSKSFLTLPLKNHHGEVIGVLQLINARAGGTVVAFGADITPLIEALASQAAVALDNQKLLQAQKDLLESFIRVIAGAIDAKSPYTGGHCQRVPVLTEMLARAAANATDGPFAQFSLNEDGWYELHLAAWLHDCGKVTTPEYVVDKSTKLETIYDRIHTVKARFATLRGEAELRYLRAAMAGGDADALRATYEAELTDLEADWRFLEEINIGGEFMAPDKLARLDRVARRRWRDADGAEQPLLDANEVENLSIARGTLTDEERNVINDHIVLTISMLKQLPFPKHLRHVVEYAGGHHEKMDGTGYPSGLTRDEMSVPARVMAIADIFEALTAADRPYKKAKTLSESIRIMGFMRKDRHIDPELFELFLTSGVYRQYAEHFLQPDQIDDVDISAYVGGAAE